MFVPRWRIWFRSTFSRALRLLPHHSPTELERAQQLAKLLEENARLEKNIQGWRTGLARQGWRCLWHDLSILQQEMRGLSFQIDAHHWEDDARREKNQSRGDDMEGVFVEEVDSGEEAGVLADGGKRRRVGKGRFGGGSSPSRVNPDYLMELMRGMSEEDQATFKRNMGSHGGDDVSSLEGDKPQVGVHGQVLTETPYL